MSFPGHGVNDANPLAAPLVPGNPLHCVPVTIRKQTTYYTDEQPLSSPTLNNSNLPSRLLFLIIVIIMFTEGKCLRL